MQHKNDPQDLKYREFLRPAFDVVVSQEPVGSRGLDYGSGPGSALAAMLAEAQYQVRLYDPFFHPKAEPEAEPTVVFGERKYDFIVCTEAAEHFHEPKNELQRMHSLLKPGGLLVMMTLLCKSSENFGQWYYTVDPTHVVFYSETTCQWIKQNLNFKTVDIVSERLVVFSS